MNTICPLPIDWLDLLEGRPSIAAYPHLDDCASCATTVAAIRDVPKLDAAHPVGDSETRGSDIIRTESVNPSAFSATGRDPQVGDIYWLEDSEHALPVVVLSVDDFDGVAALDVAPAWVDVEVASEGDLLLRSDDTTTDRDWRVVLRLQSPVPRDRIAGLIGRSITPGLAAVQQALSGQLPSERTGSALESPFDPRLAANTWMAFVLERAMAGFETSDDGADDPDRDAEPSAGIPATSRDKDASALSQDARGDWNDLVQQFLRDAHEPRTAKLLLTEERVRRSDYVLTASTKLDRAAYMARSTTDSEVTFDGLLWLDAKTDRLLFEPSQIPDAYRHMLFILWVKDRDKPLSIDVELRPDTSLVLVEDQGISERDIRSMEVYFK